MQTSGMISTSVACLFNADGLYLNPEGSARFSRLLSKIVASIRKNVRLPITEVTQIRDQIIKAFLFNARSIQNKFSDLEVLAATDEYHIIGVTEIWLNKNERDFLTDYSLSSYAMLNFERVNRSGGGVLLYVKASLQPSLTDTRIIDNVDSVTVQLKTCSRKLLIILIYRSPSFNTVFDKNLFEQITEVSNVRLHIFWRLQYICSNFGKSGQVMQIPCPFLMYVKDIDDGIKCKISKIADDTKNN